MENLLATARSSGPYGNTTMHSGARTVVLEAVKLVLSGLVGVALAFPFFQPEPVGLARELAALGVFGAIAVGVAFFALVVVYANDLRLLLASVSPDRRKAKPNSVWWMLVLPYNFIEDFFIVHAVTESLRSEAASNRALVQRQSFGAPTGYGWCVAQIGSLIPNQLGSLFAIAALILWVLHWRFVRKAMAALRVA